MANYATLKAAVQDVVKSNGNKEITGTNMQSTLLSMITSLASGYLFKGVATTSTSPGTPDENVFYIGAAGTYTNFGTSYTVPVGSIGIFKYNGSWSRSQLKLYDGVDETPTSGSSKMATSGGIFNMVRDTAMLVDKGFYIDINHLMSNPTATTATYVSSSSYDAAIIYVNGANKIKLNGLTNTASYKFYDSANIFTGSDVYSHFISSNTEGIVPSGAAVCIVNMAHTSYPSGYSAFSLVRVYSNRDDDMLVNKGFYIDTNHLMSNPTATTATYVSSPSYDTAIIYVNGAIKIKLNGLTSTANYRFYDSANIFTGQDVYSHFISSNTEGIVPSGAAVCIVNMAHTSYPNGYDSFYLERYPIDISEIEDKIEENSKDVNKGFYIDKNHLMSNPTAAQSTYVYEPSWDCAIIFTEGANEIRLNGLTSTANYRFYDSADIFTGEDVHSHFISSNTEGIVPSGAAVCIVNLKHTAYTDGYEGFYLEREYEKQVSLLLIGNSAGEDAISYVPYILKNIGVTNVRIAILMLSDSTLQQHVTNFTNESASYTFFYYESGASNSWSSIDSKSIQWALDSYKWDVIVFHQGANSDSSSYIGSIQPYLNQIANLISGYVDYNVKFAFYQNQSRPAVTNAGENWSDEDITQHYLNTVDFCEKISDETIFENIIPVGTAIQNARTIASLKAMGDYAWDTDNTSGLGYLTYDGVHLQEGLPCQIAAYTFVLAILDIYGLKEYSINGETTRVTSEWETGKNIPHPHGSPVGSTDENCLIAQKCAIMAVKKPYEVTDMSYIVSPS